MDLMDLAKKANNDWKYLDRFFKLLAEENLTVYRSASARTASINMNTKTITIPIFATSDKDVLLLLGAHEVSHALHTPRDWNHFAIKEKVKNRLLQTCINIVEDVRIERLIRNKFIGFVPVFISGYEKLLGRDFFGLNSWSEFEIHDRVNAFGKLGKKLQYELTTRELAVFRYIASAETFAEVVIRAKFLHDCIIADRAAKVKEKTTEKHKEETPDKPEAGEGEGEAEQESNPTEGEESESDSESDLPIPKASEKDSDKAAIEKEAERILSDASGAEGAGPNRSIVDTKIDRETNNMLPDEGARSAVLHAPQSTPYIRKAKKYVFR